MIDWKASMQQTFEYYIVDPETWRDERMLTTVTSCTIDRDSTQSTLGSASIDCMDDIGECYVRIYLVASQNGLTYRFPLGTFLVQTPSTSFDGKVSSISMDAYTPLIELKEKTPPIGYSIQKGASIMDLATRLCSENIRAPVIPATDSSELVHDFVSALDDTWLSFLTDLVANANFSFSIDEMGNILFSPNQNAASLRSVWTYDDGNSSILYPDITLDRDLYGIPNVVEVVYSTDNGYLYAKAVNDDPNSPISTITRGREIVTRITDPDLAGAPTRKEIEEYANRSLQSLSALEYSITYTHGYCHTRIGDCVTLNYRRAGLVGVTAKVISQHITCKSGCSVEETAIFTRNLWR